ncbi:MAG TPA: GNAT family N-acetyltransferase [Ruminiclostridium sp.]|nr:GNAT family N-acetyltransferase [Ruminiclostridium sp.]
MEHDHVKEMLELTMEQVQDEGEKRFFKQLLTLRLKECFENGTYHVVYHRDELAAFIRWEWNKDEAVLGAVLIRDTYRGQGYLEKLWERFIELCKQREVTRVVSYAEKDDSLNLSFHDYLGFRLAEEQDAEKYKWVYHMKENPEFQISGRSLPWLNLPDINGEL